MPARFLHINKLRDSLTSLLRTGFFHIFGAGTVNKLLQAILGIVLVRLLSKSEFGVYAYAYNVASFFIVLNGFGATSAAMQICCELITDSPARASGMFRFAYKYGLFADAVMFFAIIAVGLFAPLAVDGSNELLVLYCLYPLVAFLFEIKTIQMRIISNNKEYALLTNIQTALMVAFTIAGAVLFRTVGLIVGQCLSWVIAYVISCIRNPLPLGEIVSPNKAAKRDFVNIASISMVNNALNTALSLVGTFLVGALLLDETVVASYQVATTVPFAMNYIPMAVVIYITPYFIRHNRDREWTISHYAKLITGSIICMGLFALILGLFASPLTVLLFGEQYLDAVPSCRILLFGFFINAAFRVPTGNLIVTQRKLLFNTFNGVVAIVVTIAANIALVPFMGIEGAAVSYVLMVTVNSVLNIPYYTRLIRRIGDS